MPHNGWPPESREDEAGERAEAYSRLLDAARTAGVNLDRLHSMLRQVADNEAATREFLRDTVYGAPDDFIDDLIRLRVAELAVGKPAKD